MTVEDPPEQATRLLKAPVGEAVAYGIHAPNPHDTQAWKCRLVSATELLLFVDKHRLLPVTDPPARQIQIGCGCFIETLVVGMSTHGYACRVEYLPEGEYDLDEIGRKPVARIVLHRDRDVRRDDLAEFLMLRQTNRRPYSGPLLTSAEVDAVRRQLGDHVELLAFNREQNMRPLQDIFYQAMEIEARTERTADETRIWFRYNERERQRERDGLSAPQLGVRGIRRVLMECYLKNGDHERWHSERSVRGLLQVVRAGIDSARGIVMLKTATNHQLDWILAGRAFARLHLSLTRLGMSCQPYSQVLQEYDEMALLQARFNDVVDVHPPAKIQMAVRVGRADRSYVAPRRDPAGFIF
jgi:hypothetical protein